MNCRERASQRHRLNTARYSRARFYATFVSFAITVLTSGCKVGPNYCHPPAAPVASHFPTAATGVTSDLPTPRDLETDADSETAAGQLEQATTELDNSVGPEFAAWWISLNDPIMNQLVVAAVENNRDLQVAAERIFEARARRGTVLPSLLPQIDTDATFTHERRPSGGLFSGSVRDWWAWGGDLSWEIDVFGRLRRLLEAADADVGERQELYRDALILLIAETATTYAEARSHQEQLRIVAANIEVQAETVRLVRSRFENEKTDMLDVSQSEGSLKEVQAGYPTFRILYRQSINRLSVLLGCPPGEVDAIMSQPSPIPSAPEQVAVGIPAELLRRRPDIRSVERRIAAQTARIGAAVGELYPQFSIIGSFGLGATDFSALWQSSAIGAGVTPGVRWPILHFGRYRSNVCVQESLQRQYILEYENAVLQAAEDVDNALVAFHEGRERGKLLQESVTHYREAVRLAQIKYRAGHTDLQRVLDSQRSLLASQNLLVVNQMAVVRAFISLYRAMGGGWQIPVSQIASVTPDLTETTPEFIPAPPPSDP
jgi:NodT family efflux transporter outer membrane factor (OMF) lipoprotein